MLSLSRRGRRLLVAPLALLLALGSAAVVAGPAGAAVVKPIAFPVEGTVRYSNDFGAPRSGGRTHEGNDLMGAKMQRLLAAVDGTVTRVRFDNLSSGGNSVVITAADGWTYHYIHVNNDTPGTDDGRATRAQAFPPEIQLGATVRRGQVVAYMGDSGNAESTAPHLHFEIRQPPPPGGYTGVAINPYDSLRAAQSVTPVGPSARWSLWPTTAPQAATEVDFGRLAGDLPLLCDWDGDALDDPVIFRAGLWYLRDHPGSTANARTFTFGKAGDKPLCGDVDGDGKDEPVLFRGGNWYLRAGFEVGDGVAWTARYGTTAGDRPAIGDWDDDGVDDLAVLRNGSWLLRSSGGPTGSILRQVRFGTLPTDLPVSGDWDGDGVDDLAIYRGDGVWYTRLGSATSATNVGPIVLGPTSGHPVAGQWSDASRAGVGVRQG